MLSNTTSLIGILGLKFAPNLTELFVGPGFAMQIGTKFLLNMMALFCEKKTSCNH